MFEFAHPWWFLILPLPWGVWRYVPPFHTTLDAVRAPFFRRLVQLTGAQPSKGAVVLRRPRTAALLIGLGWVLVVTALADPTLRGEPRTRTASARDFLVALDLSGSMDLVDFPGPSGLQRRMDGVKDVMSVFLGGREGDRIGVLAFGAAAYVQAPFTADTALVASLIDELDVGMAGDQTMLGDAIGRALPLFERQASSQRVLLVLTDGNDTGSQVPPLQAARVAHQMDVKMYVIGVGDPKAAGEDALDEELLTSMAEATGGRYFFAGDSEGLSEIAAQLDALEPAAYETRTWVPRQSVASVPLRLLAGLEVIFLLSLWLRGRR